MNRIVLALVLSSSLGAAYASSDAPDLSKVNGSLTAKSGQTYGDVDTVNGSITLENKSVAKDVETVNGEITLDSFSRARDVSTVNGEIVMRNGVAARSVETVNGSIIGVSNLRIEQSVEAVNGSIEIGANSIVNGDVENVNGSIKLLAMQVKGNIETVNGNITIGENTVVTGNLTVKKPSGWGMSWGKPKVPRIVIGPNAQVQGKLIFEREVELYVHATAKHGAIEGEGTGSNAISAPKPIIFTGKEPDFK